MGKSLIIPGADFSINKINELEWYYVGSDDMTYSDNFMNTTSYRYYLYDFDILREKTINTVRLSKGENLDTANLTISVVENPPYESSDPAASIIYTRSVTIDKNGLQQYYFEPITLSQNQYLFLSTTTGYVLRHYLTNNDTGSQSLSINNNGELYYNSQRFFFEVDFGYI